MTLEITGWKKGPIPCYRSYWENGRQVTDRNNEDGTVERLDYNPITLSTSVGGKENLAQIVITGDNNP